MRLMENGARDAVEAQKSRADDGDQGASSATGSGWFGSKLTGDRPMRHLLLLAVLTILAVAPIAEAASVKSFVISGAFADGGHFNGGFTNDVAAGDRCPGKGVGCFYFPQGRITGEYGGGLIFADASQEVHDFSYRLSSDGDRNTINFRFGAINPGRPEFLILAEYAYLGTPDLDRPWDGNIHAIGGFLSGFINNDAGYHSAITELHLAPVPLPAGLPLLGAGLFGLLAFGKARHRRNRHAA